MIYTHFIALFSPSSIENKLLLLLVCIFSVFLKTYFAKKITLHELSSSRFHLPWIFLLFVLIGSSFGDIAWIVKIVKNLFLHEMNYSTVTFFIRIAWGFLIIHYQSLSLFIESLSEKHFKLERHHKMTLTISCFIAAYFFYLALFKTIPTSEAEREIALVANKLPWETYIMHFSAFYLLICLSIPSIIRVIPRIRSNYMPRILRKQLWIFTMYLLVPYMSIEFLQTLRTYIPLARTILLPIVSSSTLFLLVSLYVCIRKIMGLRFLNYSSHVQTPYNTNTIRNFKSVLEKMSHIKSLSELGHVTQHFFKDSFDIPIRKVGFYTAANSNCDTENRNCCMVQNNTEHFLLSQTDDIHTYLKKYKILIYDEIEFSNFYEEDPIREHLLHFLRSINAEIFIPIFNKESIIAYIIIEAHTRQREFYGIIERDEMIIFASYINHIIVLLQNKNIDDLLLQEKLLEEELYAKTQQVHQYKETIHSFIRSHKTKKIGIIFYKNRRFVFGNQEAKELVHININYNEGHPLVKKIKKVVEYVDQYNIPYRAITKDCKGNQLVLSGVPNLERSNIIIMAYYPEIADVLAQQTDFLKDPTQWDYVLYLESTQPGKLISQLIPGSGEQLMQFKLELLKTALGKKATLLSVPERDMTHTIELLHRISLREKMSTLNLISNETHNEYAIELFGINPLFNDTRTKKPLLQKLDGIGTLYIKNIHYLSLETQESLARFIRYGQYQVYKSDTMITSDVRIIVSSEQDLLHRVHNNLFSHTLYNELKKTNLYMPSLSSLPHEELIDLTENITEQTMHSYNCHATLSLSEKEKSKLTHTPPMSIQELRERVHTLILNKSKKQKIFHEAYSQSSLQQDSPLHKAELLGKQALRDQKIMHILWKKFKNQNKIAAFLGVNRSSVNRRCKQYNLE